MSEVKENPVEQAIGSLPAKERPMAEKELLSNLLAAANYRDSEEAVEEIKISRKGTHFFDFRIRPLDANEIRAARKKATKYMPNPKGSKLPPVEKERDTGKFYALLVYKATVDEDRQKIWDNSTIMAKFDLMEGWETVDILLLPGEKDRIVDIITENSGYGDDEASEEDEQEEYAKN